MIICPRCNTPNPPGAPQCNRCGLNLMYAPAPGTPPPYYAQPQLQKRNNGDVLIIIAVFLLLLDTFVNSFLTNASPGFWIRHRYVVAIIDILLAGIPLLIAFAVKNKTWKVVLIVLGSLSMLIHFWSIWKMVTMHFWGDYD